VTLLPVYDRDGITLWQAEYSDVLPMLPRQCADLILTDPPYGETSLEWDRWQEGWPHAVCPYLKATGSLWCFGSMRMFLEKAQAFDCWQFAQDVVWEKHNGSNFHADRFKRVHEHAAQFYRRSTPWAGVYKQPVFTLDAAPRVTRRKKRPTHTGHIEASAYVSEDGGPRLMRSVMYERSCHGYAIHPTQKPLGILQALIEYSCPPGGLVLDIFAGSASTLEAARLMGRRAVGIEANAEHAAAAVERLSATLPLGAVS